MIAVIGEMATVFEKRDGWHMEYGGMGYCWASRLKEEGQDALLLSVLPSGNVGKGMAEALVAKGIVFDPDLLQPMAPAISIDGEWFIRSSSSTALSAERITDAFSYFADIRSVVISSVLLSYNPAASAILDSVSFMSPRPRAAIDLSAPEGAIGSKDLMDRTLRSFSACVDDILISDDKEAILGFVR